MLKALLHNKLRVDHESNDAAAVARREDPLTAAVFERLSYLPTEHAQRVVCRALVTLTGQASLPTWSSQDPEWHFWPSLSAAKLGKNTHRVEPDLLWVWPEKVAIFEAKHRSDQSCQQWREEWLAAGERWPRRRLHLIALGGQRASHDTRRIEELRRLLPDASLAVSRLHWQALRSSIEQERLAQTHGSTQRLLSDIVHALEHWGYREKLHFGGLGAVHRQIVGSARLGSAPSSG